MAIIKTQSLYAIGRESTPAGAANAGVKIADARGLIPVDPQLLKLQHGKTYEYNRRSFGLPFMTHQDHQSMGVRPASASFSHNLHLSILSLVLGSMHGFSNYAASLLSIYPVAGGKQWIYLPAGSPDNANATFTLWHKPGATGSVNHYIIGAVGNALTLTFRQGGGPARMSWGAVGMDSSTTQASVPGTLSYPTTAGWLDKLSSEWLWYLDSEGGVTDADRIYPRGDIVVTLTPTITVEARGLDHPYIIGAVDYAATVQMSLPWDSSAQADKLLALMKARTYTEIIGTNVGYSAGWTNPSAIGHMLMRFRGFFHEDPTLEGDAIVGERGTLECAGNGSAVPYEFKIYDPTTPGTWP